MNRAPAAYVQVCLCCPCGCVTAFTVLCACVERVLRALKTSFMKRVSESCTEMSLSVRRLLTSLGGTFALNVHMAPLSVFFKGAALLVTATAVVALEGLLYCEQEFQLITKT